MRKGSWIFLAMLFALFLVILVPQSQAQESVWDMASSDQYGKKFGGMLGRGLINAATCFVDVIVHTVEGTKEGPPFVGTLTGLGSGIGCTALRATSGVLDIATSWVPSFNGIPVSRSYSNCLEGTGSTYSQTDTQQANWAPAEQQQAYQAPESQPVVVAPESTPRQHDPTQYVKK